MRTIKKQKGSQKSISVKTPWKKWKKPTIFTIKSTELAAYIRVAARSGACLGWSR